MSRERTSRATNGQKGCSGRYAVPVFNSNPIFIYVLNVTLCCSFFCSSVNLLIYVFTLLTDAGANNTFDFSIKARTSPLDRQIVSRSQRAYALGVVQVRLNLIVLIGIFLFRNIFADYNYILYKFLLFSRIQVAPSNSLGILQRFLHASSLIAGDLAS